MISSQVLAWRLQLPVVRVNTGEPENGLNTISIQADVFYRYHFILKRSIPVKLQEAVRQ